MITTMFLSMGIILCMGVYIFCLIGKYTNLRRWGFMGTICISILLSILLGRNIGNHYEKEYSIPYHYNMLKGLEEISRIEVENNIELDITTKKIIIKKHFGESE